MKNPFTSERNIFGGISRPARPNKQQNKPIQTNAAEKRPQIQKQDLNWRGQFRQNSKHNQMGGKGAIDSKYSSSVNTQSQQSSFAYGINRNEKITFGKPNASQNNGGDKKYSQLTYKRQNFVHLNQFIEQTTPKQPTKNYDRSQYSRKQQDRRDYSHKEPYQSTYSRQKQQPSWVKFQNTQQSDFVVGVSSMENKHQYTQEKNSYKMDTMMMSPIGETSKHKMDDDQFINIDMMGDDIGKILASSKNQQQLCQLLGIQKSAKGYDNTQISPQGFKKKQNPPSFIKESSQNNFRPYKQSSQHSNNQFSSMRNLGQVPTNIQARNRYQNNYIQNSHKSESNLQQISPKKNQYDQQQQDVFNYGAASSKNFATSSGHQKNYFPSGQMDIDTILTRQMNKLCKNGNKRIFLSASDKIETVRYDLEYI